MEIGIRIKRLREKQKISQTELSAILGISQTKLCHIESSEDKSIDFILMYKVCRYFNVGFEYFLTEYTESDSRLKDIQGNDSQENFPENILRQINSLIADNKFKDRQIKELLAKIRELTSNGK